MAPGAHAAALVALATDSQTDGVSAAPGRADSVVPERVRRRALRLLAAAAEGLGARLATADADEQPALAAAADAALAFCPLLSVFFVAGARQFSGLLGEQEVLGAVTACKRRCCV